MSLALHRFARPPFCYDDVGKCITVIPRLVKIVQLVQIYRVSYEEKSIFWEIIVSAILSKKVYMHMYPNPNGFRDRTISLCSCKIVDKKEMLRTVSNTGIHFSSYKVGTVYPV
jgi:hypothetical protein